MIATMGDGDLRILAREATQVGKTVLVVTPATGVTVTRAIVEVLANSGYTVAETNPVPKSNIFDTKYSRQREWWNTPKKERRRKK